MIELAMSRRGLVAAGTLGIGALAADRAIADAPAGRCLGREAEDTIRKHYQTWMDKDWHAENALLADDFNFSSAAGDDHISKAQFKKQCWDTQINHIKRFDLVRIFGSDDEAFVMYDCVTMTDKTFRNVEYLTLGGGKVKSIWCFFGASMNFPTEVEKRKT